MNNNASKPSELRLKIIGLVLKRKFSYETLRCNARHSQPIYSQTRSGNTTMRI